MSVSTTHGKRHGCDTDPEVRSLDSASTMKECSSRRLPKTSFPSATLLALMKESRAAYMNSYMLSRRPLDCYPSRCMCRHCIESMYTRSFHDTSKRLHCCFREVIKSSM